jgi:hypothetical protein
MYKPNHHFIYFFNKDYPTKLFKIYTHKYWDRGHCELKSIDKIFDYILLNIEIKVSVNLTQLIRYWIIYFYVGNFGFEPDHFTYLF